LKKKNKRLKKKKVHFVNQWFIIFNIHDPHFFFVCVMEPRTPGGVCFSHYFPETYMTPSQGNRDPLVEKNCTT